MKESKQITVKSGMTVNDLMKEYAACGVFQAGNAGCAVDIYEEMIKKKVPVMLSFAGALVPGGLRNVISECIRAGYANLVVTTGANVTHDLAIAFGEKYFRCSHHSDDKKMREEGASRIYDITSPDKTSEGFEKEIQKIFSKLPEKEYTTPELMRAVGEHITDENSIVRQCFLKNVPLFVPALEDSIFGIQLWMHTQDRAGIKVNHLRDVKEIHDWVYAHEKRGIVILGGGVPKNYVLQSALIPGPHSYAIQITTAKEEDGGLSGATLEEAVSWGKLDEKTRMADVRADATIVFPLIVAALKERC